MKPFNQIERSTEITRVLAKYGFHELVEHSPFQSESKTHPEISEEKEKLEPLSRPAKFRHLLEDLGPTFIKIGQLLSTRPDLLPEEFTREIEAISGKIQNGEIRVTIQHTGLDHLRRISDQLTTRISSAILAASLIVGSSLILHAHIPPTWNDISILGILGYLVAGFEALKILFGRVRKKKE